MQQTKLDDQRYPRWGLLRALRWIFLHWWLTPLACLLILITIYLADEPLHNGLPKFLITFWWAMLLLLIAMTVFLFWAYRRADADETYESSMLRQRRQLERERQQLEREQQPPHQVSNYNTRFLVIQM